MVMPWGEMLQGIGAGVAATGGTMEVIGNHKQQKKAAKGNKQADQMYLMMLQKALDEYKNGSIDTQGNRLRFKNGTWGYDLSNSGKAEVTNANRQAYLANAMGSKLPSAYRNQLTAQDYLAAQRQANANQRAASRQALRTGSNAGEVARSFGRAGSDYLRQAMLQNMRNGQTAQAQSMQNLVNNAQQAKNLTGTTMNNLINMHETLALPALQQNNMIAGAYQQAAKPTIKPNWWQSGGRILQGHGQAIGQLGKGMSMTNALQNLGGMNQQGWGDYLGMLK